MMEKEVPAGALNNLWKFLASIRLTVAILLSLALTSIIGTVIPQNESPTAYFREYGEFFYRIFDVLGFFDMYHSWWFQFLFLILTLNIVVCSIKRLTATWKMVFVKTPRFNVSKFRDLTDKEEFTTNRSPQHLRKIYEPVVSRGFGYSRIEKTDKGFDIFAEKGRWTRLGVYTVHFSVILMLLGALVGSIFGLEGFVNIPEGKKINSIKVGNTGKFYPLGFEIMCDDFNVSFYNSGAPKEYRSSLTILEDGNPVLKKDIIVNDPLRYKGINIFQASYGKLPPNEMTLNFTNKKTGKVYNKKATIGQPFDMPEGNGEFVIKEYRNSTSFRGQNIGAAAIGILTPNNGNPVQITLPLRFPRFDMMRKGDFLISVKDVIDQDQRYYTGLQVTRDPGVLFVYTGFVIMIVGCFITFFMSHQRLCIEVRRSGKKIRVMVAGTSNKNKLRMKNRVKKISQSLVALGQSG